MTKEVSNEDSDSRDHHLAEPPPITRPNRSTGTDEGQAEQDYVYWMSRTLDYQIRGLTELRDPRATLSRTPWDNMAEYFLARSRLLMEPLPLDIDIRLNLSDEQRTELQDKHVKSVKLVVKYWREAGLL